MGSPQKILALAMDPPKMDNIEATIMALKEIGALLPTVAGVSSEVGFSSLGLLLSHGSSTKNSLQS